jgi:hypothetical protein
LGDTGGPPGTPGSQICRSTHICRSRTCERPGHDLGREDESPARKTAQTISDPDSAKKPLPFLFAMRNDRQVLKLMPEYGVDVPLWPRSDDTDAMIPAELLQRLIRWQASFDESFHYDRGWRNVETRETWGHEARLLEKRLRQALPHDVQLVVDLWPLDGTTHA